jgi:SAM-dependent methyltransferase
MHSGPKNVLTIPVLLLGACGGSHQPTSSATSGSGHDHHHGHPHESAQPIGHRFEHADDWAKTFDDPERDAWQLPDKVVAALDIKPGMTVADIGAGTGYFEARLSAAVGSTGKVIAVDVEADMVRYIGERAKRENTPNVEARLGMPDDPKLANESFDRILIVDTWHHIANRGAYAKKLHAALRPGGILMIVDFTLETKKGPPPAHRIGPDVVIDELEGVVQGVQGFVPERAELGLPDQYVIKALRHPATL